MSTHFGPMGGGLDLDMESGDPTELGVISRQAQAEERRNRRLEQHAALVEDLAGQGGVLARQIAAGLAARIEVLIAQDPEATTLLKLLRECTQDLHVGERIARDEMAEILRKEFGSG